ncbi:MAG: response regulator [Alphaproteobacteria bacterium]
MTGTTERTGDCPEILIVDDEDMIREMLRDALEAENHTVAEAADGKEALGKILSLQPRIVVSDVRMPGMNGYEVLHEIRHNHPELASIPFIFLTAISDKSYINAAYKIGADDFLTKPVDIDVLCMKIGAMLHRLGAPSTGQSGPEKQTGDRLVSEFERKLQMVIAQGGGAVSACLRLISLKEYEAEYGAQWAKLQPVAAALAEKVLRKHLSPGEVYAPQGGDGFLVLLPDADEDTARRRIDTIASEIRLRLVGEEKAGLATVNVTSDVVDVRSLGDNSGSLNAAFLADMFEGRKAETPNAPARPDPKTWFVERLSQYYRPLWDAKRQMVIAVQCVPVRTTPYGVLTGRSTLHGGVDDPWTVELDRFMIRKAIDLLLAQAKVGRKPIVSIPVHYRSINSNRIAEIEKPLGEIPGSALRTRLMLEVIGLPEHHGIVGMRNILAFAKRHSDFYSIEIRTDDPHIGLLKDARTRLLQMEAPPPLTMGADTDVGRGIQKFARDTIALGMQPRVNGIDLLSRFKAARNANVLFMTGSVIGRRDKKPVEPFQLPESRIAGG